MVRIWFITSPTSPRLKNASARAVAVVSASVNLPVRNRICVMAGAAAHPEEDDGGLVDRSWICTGVRRISRSRDERRQRQSAEAQKAGADEVSP